MDIVTVLFLQTIVQDATTYIRHCRVAGLHVRASYGWINACTCCVYRVTEVHSVLLEVIS